MKQLSLFGETDEVAPSGGTILCRHCHKEKPREMFRLYRRATGDRESRSTSCKECQKSFEVLRKNIRENAPTPEGYCECCNKPSDKLVLDHCYKTNVFRGWLCTHCNMSIGLLGDNVEGLRRAIDYLKG